MTLVFSSLVPLEVPGEKLVINQGDTVRVTVTLSYTLAAEAAALVTLDGAIGTRQNGEIVAVAVGTNTAELAPSTEETSVQISVDIPTSSSIPAGTYSLFVVLREYTEVAAEAPDCIEVAGAPLPPDILSMMLPMMVMVMMMSAILPMMEGEEKAKPKLEPERQYSRRELEEGGFIE